MTYTELLTPLDDLKIIKSPHHKQYALWSNIDKLFLIKRRKNQWEWSLAANIFNPGLDKLDQNSTNKFPTLKQAHHSVKKHFQQNTTPGVYNSLNMGIEKKYFDQSAYFEVLNPHYNNIQDWSPIYISGSHNKYLLHLESGNPIELASIPEELKKINSQTFFTKPLALKSLYRQVALYLPELYFQDPEDYLHSKEYLLQTAKAINHDLDMTIHEFESLWWVLLTNPQIDLSKIFV